MSEEDVKIEKEEGGKEVTVDDVTEALLKADNVDEKKSDGPPPDHPRWNEIYRKGKELERETEQLKKEREADKVLMDEMRKHHEELKAAIERSTQATEKMSEATVESLSQKKADVFTQELSGIHSKLVEQKRTALENNDLERVAEIDDKIMDVKLEMREHKKKADKKETPKDTHTGIPGAVKPDQAEVAKFKSSADWFDKDAFMTGAAIELEKKLLNDPLWQARSYAEILGEVKSKVEERFNYGKSEEKKKGVNAVEGGGNVSGKGGPTTIHLTARDLEIAKGLGITPEQLAKEKAIKLQGRV